MNLKDLNASKVAADLLALATDAAEAAAGDAAAAVAAIPKIKDLAAQLVVLLPPVDAADLLPADRAVIDDATTAELDAKFPKG